jgi:hypothetical protein
MCRRCHGTGDEPEGLGYDGGQESILDALAEIAPERRKLVANKAYTTTVGRLRLDEIYAQARRLVADGEALGVQSKDMIDALGITSAAFYRKGSPYRARG